MPFNVGDLVWAKRHPNGGYHQTTIDMEIAGGNQFLVSWVYLHRKDMIVPRRALRRFDQAEFEHLLRTTRNQMGGQETKEECICRNK
eukprot:8391805-Ditylum_brightwellii.AAC.1